MIPLNIRLRKSEFDAVKRGKKEVVKYASSKRIHYLCFSRVTCECKEPQSSCRKCFEDARECDGYMCYPFDRAIVRRSKTDERITKSLANVFWEERDGKVVFVFKFENQEKNGRDESV